MAIGQRARTQLLDKRIDRTIAEQTKSRAVETKRVLTLVGLRFSCKMLHAIIPRIGITI